MLNEFVYCRRLFYYEFVEGVFVESADTLRGAAIHQRVDTGSGALPAAKRRAEAAKPKAEGETTPSAGPTDKGLLPLPGGEGRGEGEPETIHSRSVQMGSERLGVVAKMDLVEVRAEAVKDTSGAHPRTLSGLPSGVTRLRLAMAGQARPTLREETGDLFTALEVCPVDYKAGAPREGQEANELWDTDKMQLGLQALILRENGYTCSEGIIYYRATKQRVRLSITPELQSWILENVAEAKRVVTGPIPAPLVNSPKCVRCSLAPVCLPDETRMLARTVAGRTSAAGGSPGTPASAGSFPGESAAAPLGPPLVGRVTPCAPLDPAESPAALAPGTGAHPRTLSGLPSGVTRPTRPPALEEEQAPRRLMAARDDTRPLYLNTPGLRVGCSEEVLQIKDKGKVVEEVRARDLSHVALFGNIQISTQAVQSLCELEVPITYFSMGGWFYGITRGHGLKNVFLRIEQFRLAREEGRCLALARQFVHGKIRNHRTLLMRNHLEPPEPTILKLKRASEDALEAASAQELLGVEGAAASLYFQQFSGMIKTGDDLALPAEQRGATDASQLAFNFNFANRNRRPPTDPVNAMLSLAYSMLTKDCTLAALAVGFDPYIGFYHQPRFGRPALGLDLMEEFRPLVAESTVLSCINNRVVTEKDFVRAGQAVNLSAPGRKRFFQMYEQRMSSLITHPLFDYKVSYRRALELQARLLAKALTGEIAEYVPLLTR